MLADFETSLEVNKDAWSLLLRDREGPLPPGRSADQVFWMVEMMESWFHADKASLARFYGTGFRERALKPNPRVEEIPKADLVKGLREATRHTAKGNYFDHKTTHGPRLLEAIDPALVREAAPNCDRLFRAVLSYLT